MKVLRVLMLMAACSAFFSGINGVKAQTDTEFWFSVPEINRYHWGGNESSPGNKGYPVYLRITTGTLPSTVTITMPANPANFNGGNPLVFTIPANKTQTIDLAALNLIGDDKTTPLTSIENRLRWTTSNPAAPKPYINRNNKGLHIEATAPVTIYYEISAIYNMELLALKGKNALGKTFYIPFETTYKIIQYTANNSNFIYRPYSSFEIVATEDNTEIRINPTRDVFVYPAGSKPANTPFTIWLNRGETAIVAPYKNDSEVNYKTDPDNTLAGTKVEVVSGGSIAINTRHDMVNPVGGVDFVGDQLVPIDHIGYHYAVVRGVLANDQEHVYVVATQNGTNIKVNGVSVTTINERGVYPVQIPSGNLITTIEADKPVYVYHLSGFGNGATTQVAGAIIPTITTCTGSSRVGFNRTKANYDNGYGVKYYDFYMNILVRKGAEDGFKLYDKNGNDVTAIVPGLNNPASYQDVGTTAPYNEWRYARFKADNIQAGVDEAYLLENSKDVFHLGILNGNANADAFYGYFSDFNTFNPTAFVVVNEAGGNKICWGDSRQLYASGGTRYQWTPHDFLDDPSSPTPVATNITQSLTYNVTVSGACGLSETRQVVFMVSDPVLPRFTTDQFAGCSPFVPTIINNSVGAAQNWWDFNNDGDFDDPGEGLNNNPTFPATFTNTGTDTLRYTISQLVVDATGICQKTFTKDVLVYPQININPVILSKSSPENCHPLTVNFRANPTGNSGTATFRWDFGDGATSAAPDPSHTYYNYDPTPKNLNAQLTITDKYNYCSVSKSVPVTIQPYIRASFAVDKVEICSGESVPIVNNSVGGITNTYWDKDGDGVYESSDPSNWTFSRTSTTPVSIKVQNAGGCTHVFTQPITVNPTPTADVAVNAQGDISCSPLTVNLNASNVVNGNTFEWLLTEGANTNVISTQQSTSYSIQNYDAFAHNYTIRFRALTDKGCQYLSNPYPVTVQPFIDADFSVVPSTNCSPVDLTLTVQKYGGINEFLWDWDNNGTTDNTYTQASQQSVFTRQEVNQTGNVRNFQPRLTVTNLAGCSRSKVLPIPIPVYPEVTANFNLPTSPLCNPQTVTLSNQSAYTGGGILNNASYSWNFGDGSTSMEKDPTHLFTNVTGGNLTFDVTLTATSEHGCQSQPVTKQLTLYPYVKSEFSIDNLAGCAPHSYNINLTKHPGIASYEFDFDGDGTYDQTYTSATAPLSIPRTQDNLTGAEKLYNVTLRVRNVGNCPDVSSIPVRVYPGVTANFTPNTAQQICDSSTITFSSTSVVNGTTNQPDFLTWDFGDGLTSNLATVTHLFRNNDTQNDLPLTVRLTASNIHGCTDSKTLGVTVRPKLTNGFTMQMSGECTPFDVTFTPTGVGATSYQWNFGGLFPNETRTNGNAFTYQADNADPDNISTYTITLTTSNSGGSCVSQPVTKTLRVYPRVVPQASALAQFACPGTPITFTNTSSGGDLLYYWEFKDAQSYATTTHDDITHDFDNRDATDKVFNVSLTATNANGCSKSVSVPVTIHPRVEANFTMAYDSICVPFNVRFTNTSLNGTNFNWDYGYSLSGVPQQQTTTRPVLQHIYQFNNDQPNTIIKPTITLTATQSHANSGLTCSSVIQKQFVDVYPKVVPSFSVSADRGCTPLKVDFTNGSTGLGAYTWNFGNGVQSSDVDPKGITFTNVKKDALATYNVWLKAVNDIGCRDSISRTITVNPKVEAAFTWDKTDGCSPVAVGLTNASTSPLYTYSWNFGDGQTSHAEQPINHVYTNGTLLVNNPVITLTTAYKDDPLCTDVKTLPLKIYPRVYPNFDAVLQGCTPHLVQFTNQTQAYSSNNQYVWRFGNGAFGYSQNPQHEYKNIFTDRDTIFTVNLTATSEHGCVDSVRKDITVFPRPYAAMELMGNYVSCPPFDVEIKNNTLGANLTFTYTFGDGTSTQTTSTANVTHQFDNSEANPKSYQIWLKANTLHSCADSVSQTIQVFPRVTADYQASPGYASCSPFEVQFTNLSTNARLFTWDFNDGFYSSSTNPSQTFLNDTESDKVYNVRLTARSEFDCVDDTVKQITIWATPRALIGVEPPLKEFPDNTFTIINQSSPAADSWNYQWYFDDNTFSNAKEPGSHTYTRWGHKEKGFTYDVSLVINSPHCKDSTSKVVYLMPPKPVAGFTQNQANGCAPHEVHFVNNSLYGDEYEWDFDDGTPPVKEFQPIHVFQNPGYYRVKLRVAGEGGENFSYGIFHVYPTPNADFVAYPSRVMLPDATVRLQNLTTDCDSCSYDWDMGDGTIYYNKKDPNHTYKQMGEFRISLWAERKYPDAICRDSISKYPAVWVEGIGYVKFPDAFKPNPSGPNGGAYDDHDMKNEVFHPIHYGVVEYKLMIFTRWGEQVFTSKDVKIGWDGYINGRLAEQGVYVWRAIGTFTNGKVFDQRGTVTLLR